MDSEMISSGIKTVPFIPPSSPPPIDVIPTQLDYEDGFGDVCDNDDLYDITGLSQKFEICEENSNKSCFLSSSNINKDIETNIAKVDEVNCKSNYVGNIDVSGAPQGDISKSRVEDFETHFSTMTPPPLNYIASTIEEDSSLYLNSADYTVSSFGIRETDADISEEIDINLENEHHVQISNCFSETNSINYKSVENDGLSISDSELCKTKENEDDDTEIESSKLKKSVNFNDSSFDPPQNFENKTVDREDLRLCSTDDASLKLKSVSTNCSNEFQLTSIDNDRGANINSKNNQSQNNDKCNVEDSSKIVSLHSSHISVLRDSYVIEDKVSECNENSLEGSVESNPKHTVLDFKPSIKVSNSKLNDSGPDNSDNFATISQTKPKSKEDERVDSNNMNSNNNFKISIENTEEEEDEFGDFSSNNDFTQKSLQSNHNSEIDDDFDDDFGSFNCCDDITSSATIQKNESPTSDSNSGGKIETNDSKEEECSDFKCINNSPLDDSDGDDFGDFTSNIDLASAEPKDSADNEFVAFSSNKNVTSSVHAPEQSVANKVDDFDDSNDSSFTHFNNETAVDSDFGEYEDFSSHNIVPTECSEEIINKDEPKGFGMAVAEEEEEDEDDFGDFNCVETSQGLQLEFSDEEEDLSFSGEMFRRTDSKELSCTILDDTSPDNKFKPLIMRWIPTSSCESSSGSDQSTGPRQLQEVVEEDAFIWHHLQDIESSLALKLSWPNSQTNKLFLASLNVDARNILFGHKWSSTIPLFAQTLSFSPLTPAKPSNTSKPWSLEEKPSTVELNIPPPPQPTTPTTVNQSLPKDLEPKIIPPAQFDWSSSGLTNPLDAPGLEREIFDCSSASCESSSVESGAKAPRVSPSPILEKILKESEGSSPVWNTQLSSLPHDVQDVVKTLPDLNFMRSKVLMFPILEHS